MPFTLPASLLIVDTLRAAYRRAGLEGGSVLLAVSGGADSSALLVGTAHVGEVLGLRAEVVTLDHGLRPEAPREVEAVVRLAARWGLPCHVRELRLAPGSGVEARAREARYAALELLRRERGIQKVATAHTASDQAETLLMRLMRGTALRGAASIHSLRAHLVRPLLERTRGEVEAFLAEQGVEFLVDPMNTDPAFLRTRVREDVLPALSRAAGHDVVPRLTAFARLAAEDEALLSGLAEEAWRRIVLPEGGLDAVGLRALEPPLRRRVLVRLLTGAGAEVDEASLTRALHAVEEGGTVTLRGGYVPGGLQLRTAGRQVRCVRRSSIGEAGREAGAEAVSGHLQLRGEGDTGIQPGTGWRFTVASGPPPAGVLVLALPRPTHWPLTVRTRRRGERLRGPAGARRLQDVMVDGRLPREWRETWPVVEDARGEVLWVPGVWCRTVEATSGCFLWALRRETSTPAQRPL